MMQFELGELLHATGSGVDLWERCGTIRCRQPSSFVEVEIGRSPPIDADADDAVDEVLQRLEGVVEGRVRCSSIR